MMEEVDEVRCSVENWSSFVEKMSKLHFFGSGVRCMLKIPMIKMRQSVLKFLVEDFDL
jgi:hypothetical protein